MTYPHLIILYGKFGDKLHNKQQAMIEERSTCGYRPYAEKFGEIIYLCPQRIAKTWEKCITKEIDLGYYLAPKHNGIIWSLKHDPRKDEVIKELYKNTVYYSCCAYDTINYNYRISLVDTQERIKENGKLWIKGKDPDYWKVGYSKLVDYLFVGARGDKNEVYFINELTKRVKSERYILWIGGALHQHNIKKTHHRIICTPFKSMSEVRDLIPRARIGIILSELEAEGFPQSFLEMTMCGVPVIYLGPRNHNYFNEYNSFLIDKKQDAIEVAENVLELYNAMPERKDYIDSIRQFAVNNYSLEKSYESILRWL